MLTSKTLQNSYQKLYTSLREYIWPIHVVSHIADFEVALYKSFPDISSLKICYNNMKQACLRYVRDDEELNQKFSDFEEILDSYDSWYAKLDVRTQGVE